VRNSEIEIVAKSLQEELPYFSDHVRLIIPKLLANSKNIRDFYILLELAKFNSTRNLILKIIKKDTCVMKNLNSIIKKKTNKTLIKKIYFAIKKLKSNKTIN
jgi:hypothetical protein|tara:strand:- start:87 stop:392 length:306 start_codon:yes stop_codon:yes gene_type:complete